MQTPSMGVREPHCSILGAVGGSAPDINGAQGGCFSQRHGANTMKCAVSLTFMGLSMSVQLIEWAHMGLGRPSGTLAMLRHRSFIHDIRIYRYRLRRRSSEKMTTTSCITRHRVKHDVVYYSMS